MGLFDILDLSAAGMEVQQVRLAAATSNMANAQTTRSADAGPYQPLHVSVASRQSGVAMPAAATGSAPFALPVPVASTVVASDVPQRLVYEPGHPDADGRGFVALPGVDPVASMMDLISISRGYEANLRAFDVTRSLLERTLELWRGR